MKKIVFLSVAIFISIVVGIYIIFFSSNLNINLLKNEKSKIDIMNTELKEKDLVLQDKRKKSIENETNESQINSTEVTFAENARNNDIYDTSYLWVILGNYATENSLKLEMNFAESQKQSGLEYLYKNLEITVNGEYSNIINFINQIENSQNLNLTINELSMQEQEKSIEAKLTINEIKIRKE